MGIARRVRFDLEGTRKGAVTGRTGAAEGMLRYQCSMTLELGSSWTFK